MNLSRKLPRSAAWLGATCLAVLLASCGGGTQVERFAPTRLIVLGDEDSVINTDGSKYTVNATVSTTDNTLVCTSNPIWVQALGNAYGFVFAQCNPNAATPSAFMYAAAGAKVDAIAGQVAQIGPLNGTDLVTLMAGRNDVLAQYARYPGVSEAQLSTELEATGASLAAEVNAIADAGGKVLISTVPDLGLTPFAYAERAANTDTDRAALLTRLTGRLNAKLRANIVNDGTRIGLLLADELVQVIVKYPATYSYVNVSEAACLSTAALPACNNNTLQPATATAAAATAANWLWADGTHLSAGGHGQLGTLAANRAAGNPF